LALCVGSVVGGAMFGDNLSFISDTTIAACNGQGCAMKDKFRANFWIALPAALATLVIIFVKTFNEEVVTVSNADYNLIQVIPYMLVLIGGIVGINVFVVLLIGIVSGSIIMLLTGSITAVDLIELVNQLRKAGAEAISINGERVVYDTYISDIDNSFVTIRGKWQYSPYTIKAIGNITYLESGIGAKQYGYIDTKKAEGKKIEMISNASITIPKIADDIEFEYIKEEI